MTSREGTSESDSVAHSIPAAKSFRIHAVETATGRRNTYVASCDSEDEASEQVLEQLGDEWQVIFVERV
jgi:hypothetical protein